jgi:hypothetical protein
MLKTKKGTTAHTSIVVQCEDAIDSLRTEIMRLAKICDVATGHTVNMAARKIILMMEKTALELFSVVDPIRTNLHHPRHPLTYAHILTLPTSNTSAESILTTLKSNIEESSTSISGASPKFVTQVEAVQEVRQLLGHPSQLTSLKRCSDIISASIGEAAAACSNFTREWTKLMDQQAIEALVEEKDHSTIPTQSYSNSLELAWAQTGFKTSFTIDPKIVDIGTVLVDTTLFTGLGRKWIQPHLNWSKPSDEHKALQASENSIKELVDSLQAPVSSEELTSLGFSDVFLSQWTSTMSLLTTKTRDFPLRVACFGLVSHGKSSLINALMGTFLLHADG